MPPCTLIFISLLFRKEQGKPPQKARIFLSAEPPKIPGKEGKTAQKSKEIPSNEKSQKGKERKIRVGLDLFEIIANRKPSATHDLASGLGLG